ncbi:MAG: DUF1127 domain-containing protein [Sedimenticola sp.]
MRRNREVEFDRFSSAVVELLKGWYVRQHQRRRLGQLDERMLRDIGISHEEALTEAKKPFWKR